MKIIDSTTIIAIFNEIKCPALICKILELKHEIVITSHVLNNELLDETTYVGVNDFVEKKQIRISDLNSVEEVTDFQKNHPGLGMGECDSMLTYQKVRNSETNTYCILDDGPARTKADYLNIKHTGLLGLLKIMAEKGIMTKNEANDIVNMLIRSNFRIPTDFVI